MKFIYADSLDYVDPGYDFQNDEFSPGRQPYWDDVFAHELLKTPPYDGLLVSRAMLGGSGITGRYSEAQSMRFMREGARRFLRLDQKEFSEFLLFGDCGAFAYHQLEAPPYAPSEMVEFYEASQFTHGCSVDHIIFEFAEDAQGSREAHSRFEVTLALAESFLREHKSHGATFTPVGVVQGWSPQSMAKAAEALVKMGFRYLAIGGLVPLRIASIRKAVTAVHDAVKATQEIRLHLLGFAKAEYIDEFKCCGVASFDSSSPLIRAFKDDSRNYWRIGQDGSLQYYTAIRVPQANGNPKLKNRVKRGEVSQEELTRCESRALAALRTYDAGQTNLSEALETVIGYAKYLLESSTMNGERLDAKLNRLREAYRATLEEMPWKQCDCNVCLGCSIEVAIFRASNRNKRRGIHNLHTFHRYVGQLQEKRA